MKPEIKSSRFLGMTRARAKVIEYNVPTERLKLSADPAQLFTLTIGLLGEYSALINNDADESALTEIQNNLIFSAHFFDSYMQANLNQEWNTYLAIVGSASYYLCDFPGSAAVMANRVRHTYSNFIGCGIDNLLLWILQGDLSANFEPDSYTETFVQAKMLAKAIKIYYETGVGNVEIYTSAPKIRNYAYLYGTPRELLFVDILLAVLKKKIANSVWTALPLYSDISIDIWKKYISKKTSIKEFWPAQHLLGKEGVFKGKSAVVQMPTSAGKTKATELAIRCAFLSNRTQLAIIVAPYKALCHEIKNSFSIAFEGEDISVNELSSTIQGDYSVDDIYKENQIVIVTPEKLLYALRHTPELGEKANLLIFDEGHQFDSGERGITYELLIASLIKLIPNESQKVLISAVISNAEDVGEWLNNDRKTVNGQMLLPTYRSLAFASFKGINGSVKTGWMWYVQPQSPDVSEYFVPYVIESIKVGEGEDSYSFPAQSSGKEIALYLGLRLSHSGPVAIFCGKKDIATNICKVVAKLFLSKLEMTPPGGDPDEISKLVNLLKAHYGENSPIVKSAELGVFAHHRSISYGVRLAVEHSMRNEQIRFVVCTSTLAQGVNLPIRYLIITNIYQGQERIKVRDFHNLMGRVGRAGMHTEGSVIFADTAVYDERNIWNKSWRWKIVKELIDSKNSEVCTSSLLGIIPITIKNDKSKSPKSASLDFPIDTCEVAEEYVAGKGRLKNIALKISTQKEAVKYGFTYDIVMSQLEYVAQIFSAIEGFILSSWDKVEDEETIYNLSQDTLAYFLADNEKKQVIEKLFKILTDNILEKIPTKKRKTSFSKTLYGVEDIIEIEKWLDENLEQLGSCSTDSEYINCLWPMLFKHIRNKDFKRCDKEIALKNLALNWISGLNYLEILNAVQKANAKIVTPKQRRNFNLENITEICESGFAFDGALLIGAINTTLMDNYGEEYKATVEDLALLQKRFQNGLPDDDSVKVYELGFSDRVIAQDIANSIIPLNRNKKVIYYLKKHQDDLAALLESYPSYFSEVCKSVLPQKHINTPPEDRHDGPRF